MTDDSPDDPPAEATDSDADGAASVAGVDIPADEDGVPHLPGADVDDPAVADDADGEGDGAQAVGMAGTGSAVTGGTVEDETRVLEFALGEERYCLDIEHVEELVNREAVTRVPNTPEYVEGVVDLRGQITTILDPKVLFDIDTEGSKELIVVFDPDGFEDQGALGWLVDDVNQVTPVAESEVDDSPVDRRHVEGVVERDGEYVIWTQPELVVEEATG